MLPVNAGSVKDLSLLHRADETQQGRNSCPRLQLLAFSLDSIMSLPRNAFHVVSALHHCLVFCLILADQIFYRSCVYGQHFRLPSFASFQLFKIFSRIGDQESAISDPELPYFDFCGKIFTLVIFKPRLAHFLFMFRHCRHLQIRDALTCRFSQA